MKKFKLPKLLLTLPLLALPLASQAQTVYTDPVGAVVIGLSSGSQQISVPFQKEKTFQGEVDAVAGTSVTVGTSVSLSGPSYVQVISGAATGVIESVASVAGSTINLGASIAGLQAGDIIAVRGHTTVADIAGYIGAEEGDGIILWNSDGSSVILDYFDGFGWYNEAEDADANSMVVFPGEGLTLRSSSTKNATYMGSVAVEPVILSIAGGNLRNPVGSLDPVNGSTIGTMFSSLNEGARLISYTTVAGALTIDSIYDYFDGFGFYNEAEDSEANDVKILPGQAMMLFSPSNTTAELSF